MDQARLRVPQEAGERMTRPRIRTAGVILVLAGLLGLPAWLRKRRAIRASQRVSVEAIESLLIPGK